MRARLLVVGLAVLGVCGGRQQMADPWAWVPGGIRQRLPFSTGGPATRVEPGRVFVLDLKRL